MQVYQPIRKRRKKTLEELKHREGMIIKNVDKEGAEVILHVKHYIKESERQLNGTKHYRYLEHDLITENKATVNKVIAKYKNDKLDGRYISDRLKLESLRTPRFYI